MEPASKNRHVESKSVKVCPSDTRNVTPGTSMVVLIVDPDHDRARARMAGLASEGIEARHAASGILALTMLERERPDCIVASAPLPDLSPLDLTEIVQRDFALRRIRVVLLAKECRAAETKAFDLVLDIAVPTRELAGALLDRFAPTVLEPNDTTVEPGTGVQGTFAVLDFAELTQTLAQARKSGCLTVRLGENRGWVYLLRGQVVHAVFLGTRGRQAFDRLYATAARGAHGTFGFRVMTTAALARIQFSIQGTTQNLLLDAALQLDQQNDVANAQPRRDADHRRQR